jgi:hypothetical protein
VVSGNRKQQSNWQQPAQQPENSQWQQASRTTDNNTMLQTRTADGKHEQCNGKATGTTEQKQHNNTTRTTKNQ